MIGKTGEAEDHASLVPRSSPIAQMDLKDRAGSVGRPGITGDKWRPTAYANLHGRIGLVFHVGDRIMAPVLRLLHSAGHANSIRRPIVAGIIFGLAGAQHPRPPRRGDGEIRRIEGPPIGVR